MTINQTIRKPIRLWPGVALGVLLVLVRVVPPLVHPDGHLIAMLGALACGVLILLWWLLFSRAPWVERLGVMAVLIGAGAATYFVAHPSIRGGAMGMLVPVLLISTLPAALVLWAVASRRLTAGRRYAVLIALVVAACGLIAVLRTDGMLGGASQFAWRWTPTPEERLLAQAAANPLPPAPAALPGPPAQPAAAAPIEPAVPAPSPASGKSAEPSAAGGENAAPAKAAAAPVPVSAPAEVRWAGFRGPARDSVIHGVQIDTDWAKSPPVQIWRRPIGPGWSSFAVAGDVLYTQEQRGEDEIVAAYRVSTGEPVWSHRDTARFYESNGGAGPRGTPTLSSGRVFTLGATGILNALDAGSGAVLWSRNVVTDTGVTIPGWGIASSPLVVNDMVVVAASGRLAAYDAGTGKPRWNKTTGGGGYSSPHLLTVDGVPQILLVSGGGATAVAPADGALLWQHPLWQSAIGIVQPATIDGDVVIAGGDGMGGIGMRRLAVSHGSSGWTAEERWTSKGLKPYFNDFVIHKGYAYGFDGSILSCIDIKDGSRKWKGGRYGGGQLVLFADQDLLLVTSEEGELALVKAAPDQFTELAPKRAALEGKTWNHPVVLGTLLLVRNGQEMAAFRLPAATAALTSAGPR